MRRFSTVPIVALGLATVFTVGVLAAPAQAHAAGLDFWNFADEWVGFREAEATGHDLDFGLEQTQRLNAASNDIAISLCADRITMSEAIRAVGTFAESSPGWIALLRTAYHRHGDVALAATDHEVLSRYLRTRIKSLVWKAEAAGDTVRAAALSARLARFDREAREPGPAPAPHVRR